MKTTLDLPESLIRELERRAHDEGREFGDVAAAALERGLSADERPAEHRVKLPIIKGGRTPAPGDELTPQQLNEILLAEEVERALRL